MTKDVMILIIIFLVMVLMFGVNWWAGRKK